MLPLSLITLALAALAAASTDSAGTDLHRFRHVRSTHASVFGKRAMGPAWTSTPLLKTSRFTTGVAAMQLTVVDTQTALIIDKAENNPLSIKGTGPNDKGVTHPAWMATLNFVTGKLTPLPAQTNSFCAGGSWLSNGSMVSVGGNPRVNAASYYDANGLTAVRIFPKCDNSGCKLFEDPTNIRLASARWYPGTCRLQDGSIMIMGGMTQGGWNNAQETDNPTIEHYPVKSIGSAGGLPVYSKFLHDALISNLFPIMHLLPGGKIFVAANERAMIYDWKNNVETRLPNLPGVRVTYPYTAASALLPLTIANNWKPTVLFCGGSSFDESVPAYQQSSQQATSALCVTMDLSKGAKSKWVKEKQSLPSGRVMGETTITPDGKVLILNGASTGMAGYANVHDPVGSSNADHPTYQGLIYDPLQPAGKRLSKNMPVSKIPRLYHSIATLLPDASILITGSNPNQDVSNVNYKTDYSVEILSPPYMAASRPSFTWCPANILFGKSFKIIVKPQAGGDPATISVVLLDSGYHTHGVAVDQKLVELVSRDFDPSTGQILVKSPRDGTYMAPGYAWLYVAVNGIPSVGCKVMVGDGSDPPYDAAAYKNMMTKTQRTHGAVVYG